ncbi:TPA: hypothetical protein ACH3X2_010511 [Trebouxia sp. C0005]
MLSASGPGSTARCLLSGEGASSKRKQRTHNNANILANHFVPSGESVEVDVVAQQGLAWIEVKAHEPFDTDSSQWLGNPGHFKGLEQQAKQQLRIAKAACNQLMWQAPTVLFHFPQGVYTDVKTQLTAMGVLVSGPGLFDPALLPPMLPAPSVSNLDVTTLCALVSEVSHADPKGPELQAWAQRVAHWRESLAAESQQPMLPMLQPYIDGKGLIAAEAAMLQFQKLLDQFGGHNERCRWQALQEKLLVFSCDPSEAGKTSNDVSAVVNSTQQAHTHNVDSFDFLQSRVAHLQAISAAQRIVFALGDDQHAVTLTANGRASDFAARQGVRLEVFVHRAVWLTGL